MKLNYKRTVLVGFAFFLICAFWQAYDNTIPLILTNKFGMSQTWSGVIMAADNILAIFMLPIFGAISDKVNSKLGKRMPFIIIGTLIASVALIFLSFVDALQLKNISAVSEIDSKESLETIYQSQKDKMLLTPDGQKFTLSHVFTEEEFCLIHSEITDADGKTYVNPDYTAFVVPARQSYAWDVTTNHISTLILFIAVLLVILLAMSIFRSPAVALMPDVTIKPLRSKGNAIINLMGSAGGIIVLVLGIVFATSAVKNSLMNYIGYFTVIAILMLISLAVLCLTVKENQWSEEMKQDSFKYQIEDDNSNSLDKPLSKEELVSLILLLASVALWYCGYNAVTSKYSVYASNILHKDYNLSLILAQAAAIVSYLPIGIISSHFGRKKVVIAGVAMLGTAFFAASFATDKSPDLFMYFIFCLAGIAWATINVNSFPMIVELASGNNNGKYTGYYYTASMAAQIVTPMFSGALMDHFGMRILFPYATFFVVIAILTMAFVKHGNCKPQKPEGQLDALSAVGND